MRANNVSIESRRAQAWLSGHCSVHSSSAPSAANCLLWIVFGIGMAERLQYRATAAQAVSSMQSGCDWDIGADNRYSRGGTRVQTRTPSAWIRMVMDTEMGGATTRLLPQASSFPFLFPCCSYSRVVPCEPNTPTDPGSIPSHGTRLLTEPRPCEIRV